MSSDWGQNRKGIRRAISENFGISGTRNIAGVPFSLTDTETWAVAGTLAYVLWVKPQQKAELERKEELARKREWAKAKGLEEVDRIKPKPDPQVTGLLKAHRRPEKEDS